MSTVAGATLPPRWPLPRCAPDRPLLLGYHRSCPDGALAAALLSERLRSEGSRFDLLPLEAGRAPAKKRARGRDVVLIDLCPGATALASLIEIAASVFVLDHHVASEPVAAAYPKHVFLADGRCGALLCWQMLHGDADVPEFVRIVNAVDHYRMDDPDIAALSVLIRDARTPRSALALAARFTREREVVLGEARQAARNWRQRVAEYAKAATPGWLQDVRVRTVELAARDGALASDVGNAIAAVHGGVALVYRRAGDKVRHSLRSRPGHGPAVHELAARFGGGGHRHAAGMISDDLLHRSEDHPTGDAVAAASKCASSRGKTSERQREPENKP